MELVDANILIYALVPSVDEHAAARAWLERALDDDRVVLAWSALYAVVRVVCDRRIFRQRAPTVAAAWRAVEILVASAPIVVAGRRHGELAARLAATPGLRSEDVPDVELAALAIEHGLVLATRDRGFRRFEGLRTVDPLADGP